METAEVSRILGGEEARLGRLENQLDLIECSRQGLAKAALVHLATHLSLTVGQLAELLPISERTLQRHAATDRLNGTVSEQLLQIAAVAARGEFNILIDPAHPDMRLVRLTEVRPYNFDERLLR